MPKYVIEREIPRAGNLSVGQPDYIAPNEDCIRKHASQGGFPANWISEVKTVIDPTTATDKEAKVGNTPDYCLIEAPSPAMRAL